MRSQNSFYKKASEKKDRQKELLEEYLEKRTQVKKQQERIWNEKMGKAEPEKDRLLLSEGSERQRMKASDAYEANIVTGTGIL